MGTQDQGDKGRGWSLVFDEHTDRADTDEHPEAEANMTVIDRDMSREISAALNAHAEEEALIRNVPVTDAPEGEFDGAPEMTIRAPVPTFEGSVRLFTESTDDEETASADDDRLARAVAAHLEGDPDLEATIQPDKEIDTDSSAIEAPENNAERTQKALIPYDLFHEGSLPEIVKKAPTITRRKVDPAERAPTPPRPPRRSGSETMLDLAAQLGMAPEAKNEPKAVIPEERPKLKSTMELPSAPNDEIDLLPFLEEGPAGQRPKNTKKPVPVVKQERRPAEGPSADAIHRMVARTDAAARAIPIILASFVILSTITALALLFGSKETKQAHVEMRFVSLAGPAQSAARSSETTTRIAIDTIPEGVFVLYGRDVLGKTPMAVEMPLDLDERVGVEFRSPYYERWVGEVVRDPTGEYRVFVELTKKK